MSQLISQGSFFSDFEKAERRLSAIERQLQALQLSSDGVTSTETVTSLPASPVDGQEIYYLADSTNGIVWHFRYRSGSASAYKWEYIGGAPLYDFDDTDIANPTEDVWTATSAAITLPLAGDYTAEHVGLALSTTLGSVGMKQKVFVNAVANDAQEASIFVSDDWDGGTFGQQHKISGATSGHVADVRVLRDTAIGVTFYWRWLRITPIRVG